MPVFGQTYRTYDGTARRWFRWWVIVGQELRILFASWAFRGLFALGMLHVFFRLLQVLSYDVIAADPDNPITVTARGMAMLAVDEGMFFDFIRFQSSIVFLVTILAGSGMICNDIRYNLLEVYFSKPLTWWDYVLGKVASLAVVGLLLTAAPGLLLLVLHNLFLPGLETLAATYWWSWAIVVFSLAVVMPCALAVLASSALLGSQRFAGIAVFMLLFADLAVGTTLPNLLNQKSFLIVAFPAAINHVGQVLFRQERLLYDLDWKWSAGFIAVVCLVALGIVCHKVRRAEEAA